MWDPPSTKRKNEEISDVPAKKHNDSFTITMPIPHPHNIVGRLTSPTHTSDGLIWSLLGSYSADYFLTVYLQCKGDGSSELWRTEAEIQMSYEQKGAEPTPHFEFSKKYHSWEPDLEKHQLKRIPSRIRNPITSISVTIVTMKSGSDSFGCRPIHDIRPTPDVTLVLDGQRFPLNKQMLAAQSSYFNRLFYGDFKESKQEEIEIKNADPEDFHELLKMIQGVSSEPTTVDNAIRYLTMADMFDVQIVKDRMENFLLSTDLITIHRKLLIAGEHNLKTLKAELFNKYNKDWRLRDVVALTKSPEYDQLSSQVAKDLMAHVLHRH